MKVLTRKRLVLLFVVGVAILAIAITTFASKRSPKMVKVGRIEDIEYHVWHNNELLSDIAVVEYGVTEYFLDRPPVTILYFEDGEAIPFVGILDDVEIGVKYRIIYHERYVYSGNVHWTDYYHEVDDIETIE